jgi:hypothetical protein
MSEITPEDVAQILSLLEPPKDAGISTLQWLDLYEQRLPVFIKRASAALKTLAARLAEVEAERGVDAKMITKTADDVVRWKHRAEAAEALVTALTAELAEARTQKATTVATCPYPESYDRGECCGGYCTMPGVDGEPT